ncbi:MAG: MoaD family protein [Candidatus Bathyarchaeia archaeon]
MFRKNEFLEAKQPGSSSETRVSVKLFTTLREIIGKSEEIICLQGNVTAYHVLKELARMYGHTVAQYIFEGEKLRDYLEVLVDGHNVSLEYGLETRLKNGSVMAILPPAGGGSRVAFLHELRL